jgi:CheY-like chemotaxis protein
MAIVDHKPTVILLVEDETLVRMIASDVLTEDAGYRVIEAGNADEALTLLEVRHDVRLVFTDVDMPGSLNGYALARIVDMRWPGIGVIVTSGLNGPASETCRRSRVFSQSPIHPRLCSAWCTECSATRQSRPSFRRRPAPMNKVPQSSRRPSRSIHSIAASVLREAWRSP